jgi:hypothetical protein
MVRSDHNLFFAATAGAPPEHFGARSLGVARGFHLNPIKTVVVAQKITAIHGRPHGLDPKLDQSGGGYKFTG